jgi:DNA helicase-2/ATP-dependent DNA helicase PcrA
MEAYLFCKGRGERCLCYLRQVINPKDERGLMRVINYPARGIGNTTENNHCGKSL